MSVISRIILNKVSYHSEDRQIIPEVDLSFSSAKYGIVGRNGIGKSTLLKLITGEIHPTTGAVQIDGKIAYFSQEIINDARASVAEALGVAERLQALHRIAQGGIDENDYALAAQDWRLEEKIQRQLSNFSLDGIDVERELQSQSGGEQTRIFLAKAFLAEADYLILDEPTNNLDTTSRQMLYQAISTWKKGMIIVSHDRELLNLMENIVEMSALGMQIYGGNYNDYTEQKQIEQAAARQTLQTAEQLRRQAKALTQERKERHEQAKAKGRLARKTEIAKVGILKSRMAFNSAQGRSERTQKKINAQAERKLAKINESVLEAREKIAPNQEIHIDIPRTRVPNGKMILEIKNIYFNYPQQKNFIFENFSLSIQGPQRLAISGDNGSGKTTLIKLILGELSPCFGEIQVGTDRVNYLDQKIQLINPKLSVLDNFLYLNPDIRELERPLFSG